MSTITIPEKVGTTINTTWGEALYSHTEVEDANERWNDNWYISRGEFVIHAGSNHHVFIRPEVV